MKNRLVSFVLALLMVLPMALAGCSNTNTDEATDDSSSTTSGTRATMTLTLWLPTDEDTTEEAIEAVKTAINEVTKAKFKTNIDLRLIPSGEYEAAVDERITYIENAIAAEEAAAKAKREEAKKLKEQGITTESTAEETESTETEEETIKNELGMTELKYPGVGDQQFDIFLIRGYDNYKALCERDALSILDDELNGASKLMKTYIYPTFLDLAKYNGSTYAIPNNHVVGEYTFLAINKDLVDKYYYDIDNLSSLLKCKDFILDMAKSEPSIPAFVGTPFTVGMRYWSSNGSDFSVLASQITNTSSYNTKTLPKNIFSIKAFTDTYIFTRELEAAGVISNKSPEDVDKFAVGLIKGGAEIYEEYGDEYYLSIYEKPRFEDEDIYGAMFAVSAYTKNLSRSMEIINYINTDPTLRTILQYGVEGVHYSYDEETKTIAKLSDDYKMNLVETGNVYMTYPDYGVPMSYWSLGKTQNQETCISPFIKFTKDLYYTDTNKADFAALDTYSADVFNRLKATPVEALADTITALKEEVNANAAFMKMTDTETSETSLAYIYSDWYETNYPSS